MPVSPDMAEDLASAVSVLYEQAELALIEKVTKALAEGIDSPLWVQLKLAAVGNLHSAILEIISALQADASGAIGHAVAEAYNRGQQAAVLELGAVATGPALAAAEVLPTAPAVDRLAQALVQETGATHARILRTGLDVYRQVVAEASAAPLLGAQTRRQAAEKALEKFAAKGVTGFVDRSGRAWNLTSYAEMATRSAVGRAAVQAHDDRLAAAGINLVMVSDAPEECPRCKPWEGKIVRREGASGAGVEELEHATEDDRMVRVRVAGSLPEAKAAGLMHPNCFPGGVLVSSPSDVLAADARRYEGEIIVIHTASGVELPVTPNHPVLTPEGWVPAGSLKVGDNVLRYGLDVQGSPLSAPGDQQVPARIRDVFDALRESSQVASVRVPVAAEQFHGDGLGSDVEVVLADGLLRSGRDAEIVQSGGEGSLLVGGVRLGSLLPDGAAFQIGAGADHPSHSVVRRGGEGGPLCGRHSREAALHGLAPCEGRVSVAPQPAAEGDLVDADGGRGFALGLLAGEVALDGVVELSRRHFDGHVYNLQTGDGWYVAEGIVVHNCRHSISIYLPGVTKPLPPKADRTRATYEQSQQQRSLERQVRAWKRRAAGAIDDTKKAQANAKVREYQGRIRQLVSDTGLPRKSHREQIDTQARPATAEQPARTARRAVR